MSETPPFDLELGQKLTGRTTPRGIIEALASASDAAPLIARRDGGRGSLTLLVIGATVLPTRVELCRPEVLVARTQGE